jgi:hypothetical protein
VSVRVGAGNQTTVTEEQTCGQGLADNSALPARMADVTGRLADILELHLPSLDLTDPLSQREHDVYRELLGVYRDIATRMRETAQRMAGYRDLPMGRHDLTAAADPRMVETFSDFVRGKRELRDLLRETEAMDDQMLSAMRASPRSTTR